MALRALQPNNNVRYRKSNISVFKLYLGQLRRLSLGLDRIIPVIVVECSNLLHLSIGGIHLGINYTVLNETKSDRIPKFLG